MIPGTEVIRMLPDDELRQATKDALDYGGEALNSLAVHISEKSGMALNQVVLDVRTFVLREAARRFAEVP